MAYTCVRVIFEIGHVATARQELTKEGFTHDWELYLRGADNTEIHHFVEKVIFHLHETFPNPRRVIKEPPYVVYETGYAGFKLNIDVYLKNKHEPLKIRFPYELTLLSWDPKAPPFSNVKREKHVFKNPSEDFRRKLIKGGGVGVGADSASGSHTNHMAALNSDHSTDDHKSFNNKNKASPQDVSASSKKSKKENTPKNEEQLSANDPFSIFGQPIKTSKIPLVSKSSSKNQISDKQPPTQEKQSHSSKSSKHGSSSHKDKDKDKDRGGGGVEKEKTKEKEKEKNSSMKRSSKEITGGGSGPTTEPTSTSSSSSKKDKFKDDKVRILKVSSKDDSKKNSYHEDKPSKEKSSSSTAINERQSGGRGSADKEVLKVDKKEKVDKKHKDEKKSKSKDKYKQNEKKENIDVIMKEAYVNDRSEKLFSNSKEDYKEEKKFHRIVGDEVGSKEGNNKVDKISGKEKSGAIAEAKNLFNNNNNNSVSNNNQNSNSNAAAGDSQIINNGERRDPEVKHKHHKHKKDKSKKDSKRDKEERKEKKESKENKERLSTESQQQQQQQSQPPAPQPAAQGAGTPQSRSTPKPQTTNASLDSPRRPKKPVKALFEPDNSDSEASSVDEDRSPPCLPPAHPRLAPAAKEVAVASSSSPEMNPIKEEPGYNKHEEQTKEEKYETQNAAASTKKRKKNSEERENKKRKRKSKDKEENATNASKMIKYESCPHPAAEPEMTAKQIELERRPPKSGSPSDTKFTDEYITKLKELQRKIMTLEDNLGLQRIVQVVAETGQYEITTKTFDFDLCMLDESIVQRLLDFFVP